MEGEQDARDCSCEDCSTSEHGVVAHAERLARVVISPNHINAKGEVKPGVLPLSHIVGQGLSLIRRDKIDQAEMTKQAEAIAATQDGGEVKGLMITRAEAARQILDASGKERGLCVVDDPVRDDKALPDNPAHAVIIGKGTEPEQEKMRLREALLKGFGPLTAIVDEYAINRD
jgi:hypothetical protein